MLQCETFSLLRYFEEYDFVLSSLMFCKYVRNYDIHCWFKPFFFFSRLINKMSSVGCTLKIHTKMSKQVKDFFSSFLCKRLQFFRYKNKEIHNILIKLKEIV